MDNNKKIKMLEKLISKSTEVSVKSSSDPKFKSWRNLVERTLIKIFGSNSHEIEQFNKLRFFYNGPMITNTNYSSDHSQVFKEDNEILKKATALLMSDSLNSAI